MRIISIVTILLFSLLVACGKNKSNEGSKIELVKVPAFIPEEDAFDYDTLRGMYEGDFGKSPIRIFINYISGSNAIGYNIHKGLQRNLNGKVSRHGDTTIVELSEPGDHEYDGKFLLTFIGMDKEPTGTWEHNEGWVPSKKFVLKKYEPKEAKDDEIISSNFSNYFDLVFDSLGTYYFEEDGLVRYEYYPVKNNNSRVEQLIEVTGSWYLKDSTLKVEWQKNNRFAKPTTQYTVTHNEWGGPMLRGEGMELYPMYW